MFGKDMIGPKRKETVTTMTSAKETWSVDKVMDWITTVELLFHLAMTAAMILKNVSKRHC